MSETFRELVAIMDRLREPDGCPWDREQTLESLVKCVSEEHDEVLAAMRAENPENLKEELGDLLFNLIFVARVAKERGWFTMEDVLAGIRDKIVRRHPHVFGEGPKLATSDEVLDQWRRIKKKEKES